jgi:hypothetical protein
MGRNFFQNLTHAIENWIALEQHNLGSLVSEILAKLSELGILPRVKFYIQRFVREN